jgi:alanyl-tRNA synthetase
LVRRAIRYGHQIGIQGIFCFKVAERVIKLMSEIYPELKKNQDFIIEQLVREEEKFNQTLEKGIKEFEKMAQQKKISGHEAFILFSTYGFPFEMTQELANEQGFNIDSKDFNEEFKHHQNLSRQGAEKRFKGGLADHSEIATQYHTTTHLLHQALRQVLGEHVEQKGSNITAERLRFDFSHGDKMTPEQIQQVENIVNEQIKKGLPVKCEEMTVAEAKQQGAIGLFEQKYGDKVKVYSVGEFSQEICGGPHIKNTNELGEFKIIKEESSSAGIRRIKAILK